MQFWAGMITEQFHRHRRQWTGAAVPIRPHRASQPCGPTFVSEPDRFRGHVSDLWRYLSATIICIQTHLRPTTLFVKFCGKISTVFSEWVHHGWYGRWSELSCERQTGVGGHAPDVTGPVTWLQQLETRSTTNGKEPPWEMQSDWSGRIQGLTGQTWVKGLKGKSLEEQNLLWKKCLNRCPDIFHQIWNMILQSSVLRGDWAKHLFERAKKSENFLFQIFTAEFSGGAQMG